MHTAAVGNVCECWEWTASVDKDGYGQTSERKGERKHLRAHRVSYEMHFGVKVPAELVMDHLCRNRSCVNPWHLEPVTNRENTVIRGETPQAKNASATHCVNGHEFTPENTYTRNRPNGGRICRACIFRRTYERRAKLKRASI